MFIMISKIKSKFPKVIVAFVMVIIGYFSSQLITLPWSVQQGMFAVGFIYLGYVARRIDAYKLIKTNFSCIVLCISGIVLIFIMGRYSLFEMFSNYCRLGFIDYAAALIISCAVIILSFYIEKLGAKIVRKGLVWIGQNSLYILCVHYLDANILRFGSRQILNMLGIDEIALLMLSLIISTVLYCIAVDAISRIKNARKEVI